MVMGKLPVPDCRGVLHFGNSSARAYYACSSAGGGCLDIFTLLCPFSHLSSFFLGDGSI